MNGESFRFKESMRRFGKKGEASKKPDTSKE
jgi:hypothetical protein